LIRQWLKAGVVEDGATHATPQGTPQGGVISPLLLNVALHGMEATLGVTRNKQGRIIGKRAVVRYADDRAPRRREGSGTVPDSERHAA